MITQPFTYLLIHIPTGKRYYGVRFRKGCRPSDLWSSYFSSSKIVKQLIEQDGVDSFSFNIRKIFTNQDHALSWEQRVLKRLNVTYNDQWLNQHISSEKFRSPKQHSSETKEKIRKKLKARKLTDEHKQKLREAALIREQKRRDSGWKMPPENVERRAAAKRGVPRSPEMIEKMRASKKGKRRKYLSDGSFIMVNPKDL
jgi:hypothetical protein